MQLNENKISKKNLQIKWNTKLFDVAVANSYICACLYVPLINSIRERIKLHQFNEIRAPLVVKIVT